MPTVSTEILEQGRFSDGIHLKVKLTSNLGIESIYHRKVPLGTDINAFIITKVANLDRGSIQAELRRAVYTEAWDYVLVHASLAQLAAFMRKEYREVKYKKQRLIVARRLIEWVEKGRFTVVQVRTAFAMDAAEWVVFRDKLLAIRDADNLINNTRGE